MADGIRVEVCYARPEVQAMVALIVPIGTTALQAAQQSGLTGRYPEIDLTKQSLGIRGKRVEAG
jgi:putative ubiquitin-RnfH superfamily antitoxin RatB of RatAB toxin-antitoxin module